jgi:hypothetical protein
LLAAADWVPESQEFSLSLSLLASGARAGAAPSQQPVSFTTQADVLDGKTFDIAGPKDLETHPTTKRVWLAQGRARLALRASTRERLPSETRTFNSFDAPAFDHKEQVKAVEYGDLYKRLYTLTADEVEGAPQRHRWCLYAEDASDPANPIQMGFFKFEDHCWYPDPELCNHAHYLHFPSWDPLEDVKLYEDPAQPHRDLLVVRSKKRLITIWFHAFPPPGPWGFEIRGWANELFLQGRGPTWGIPPANEPWFHDSAGIVDAFKMALLSDFSIAPYGDGRLMAYVAVESGGWGLGRPFAELAILCDLDQANGYVSPSFDADPGTNRAYVVFNPLADLATCPNAVYDPPSCPHTPAERGARKVYGLDAYRTSGASPKDYLLAACGVLRQLQRVDVTGLFPLPPNTPSLVLTHQTPNIVQKLEVDTHDDCLHVVADPDTPHQRAYVLGRGEGYVCDIAAGGTTTVASTSSGAGHEPSGAGPDRDAFVMRDLPDGEENKKVLWAALSDAVDHVAKIYDLTWPPPSGYVELVDQYYAMAATDGAVAIEVPGQVWPHVYLSTFGGLVHYAMIGGSYQYVGNRPVIGGVGPASYQPTEEPYDSGIVSITEHTDVVNVLVDQPSNTYRDLVLTATASGAAFTQFPIQDLASMDPDPAHRFNPDGGIFNDAIKAALGCSSCPGSGSNPCPWCLSCSGVCVAGSTYGNDNFALNMSEHFAGADNKFVLVDLTNFEVPGQSPVHTQVVLSAFRWRVSQQDWLHVASVASPLIQVGSSTQLSNAIAVGKEPQSGKLFAFVAHDEGVVVFDITGLPPNSTDPLGALAFVQNISTVSPVFAMAFVKGNLFFMENGSGSNLKLHSHTWQAGSGSFTANPPLDISEVIPPANAGGPNRSPGPGIRARVRQLATMSGSFQDHDVFFACWPFVMRWRWPGGSSGSPDPTLLNFTGYWRTHYDSWLHDCRIYDLVLPGQGSAERPYLLVSKDTESFALVGPVDVTAP